MSRILKTLAIGCLAVAVACSTKTSEEPSAGGAPGAAVATVNANCPIMGNPVEADGGTVVFRGQTVGFCCENCVPKFEKLSDAEKVAALAKHGTTLPE